MKETILIILVTFIIWHFTRGFINRMIEAISYGIKNHKELSLIRSIRMNNKELIRLILIKESANPNFEVGTITPLLEAIQFYDDDLEIIKILVENGADVNKRNMNGMTPLIYASSRGKIELVKFLLEKGADINRTTLNTNKEKCKCSNGYTSLMYAIRYEKFDVADYLIDNGADLKKISHDGNTILTSCIFARNLPLLKKYIENGCEDLKNIERPKYVEHYTTEVNPLLLSMGCVEGLNFNKEMTTYLLGCDVNVNVSTRDGYTPLILACAIGDLDLAKTFLEKGVEINAKDNYGYTALDISVKYNFPEIRDFLLSNGAIEGSHVSTNENSSFGVGKSIPEEFNKIYKR